MPKAGRKSISHIWLLPNASVSDRLHRMIRGGDRGRLAGAHRPSLYRAVGLSLCVFVAFGYLEAQTARKTLSGEEMYKQSCAPCHDAGVERAPQRGVLMQMTAERVLAAMESGEMVYMAARWPVTGRRAIAEFVTGKKLGEAPRSSVIQASAACPASAASTFALKGSNWNGWGPDTSNSRFRTVPPQV